MPRRGSSWRSSARPLQRAFALAGDGVDPAAGAGATASPGWPAAPPPNVRRAEPDVGGRPGDAMVREPARAGPGHLPGRLLRARRPGAPGPPECSCSPSSGHGRPFGRPVGGSRRARRRPRGRRGRRPAVRSAAGSASTRSPAPATAGGCAPSAGDVVTARRAVVSAMAPRPFLLGLLAPAESCSAAAPAGRARCGRSSATSASSPWRRRSPMPAACRRSGASDLDGGAMWLLADPGDRDGRLHGGPVRPAADGHRPCSSPSRAWPTPARPRRAAPRCGRTRSRPSPPRPPVVGSAIGETSDGRVAYDRCLHARASAPASSTRCSRRPTT